MTEVSVEQSAARPIPAQSSIQPTSLAQRLVIGRMEKLKHGSLTFNDRGATETFGDTSADLNATVTINDAGVYQRMLTGGSLGAADAYLDGDWDCDDLTNVIRVFARNLDVSSEQSNRASAFFARIASKAMHWFNRNTKSGSRRNIEAHYDLGNDFFKLFLDETMMYSSAVFEDSSMTLAQASTAKLDRICRKLQLGPSDHVVEIGTGWGGFAHHAAANYGCKVTTTTISKEQHSWAVDRIKSAGLNDRVEILLEDYRDLTGQYDKLVSIEMIEAVGAQFLDTYFRKCGSLLKSDGAMALQGIVMPDQRYASYLKSVDFIQKYIFPGGALPSVSKMLNVVAADTDMRLVHLEDIAAHYARTLVEWRERFNEQLDEVRLQGFPERFIRMWNYYFCYCEAGFEERTTGTSQLVFAKPKSKHETAQNDRVAERIQNQLSVASGGR